MRLVEESTSASRRPDQPFHPRQLAQAPSPVAVRAASRSFRMRASILGVTMPTCGAERKTNSAGSGSRRASIDTAMSTDFSFALRQQRIAGGPGEKCRLVNGRRQARTNSTMVFSPSRRIERAAADEMPSARCAEPGTPARRCSERHSPSRRPPRSRFGQWSEIRTPRASSRVRFSRLRNDVAGALDAHAVADASHGDFVAMCSVTLRRSPTYADRSQAPDRSSCRPADLDGNRFQVVSAFSAGNL